MILIGVRLKRMKHNAHKIPPTEFLMLCCKNLGNKRHAGKPRTRQVTALRSRSGPFAVLPELLVAAGRSQLQTEVSAMRIFPQLLRLLLIRPQSSVDQRSSFALIVIFALSTFETGHPAFASAAAF